MSAPDLPGRLLVITDRGQSARPIAEIAAAICAPDTCGWLLFRDKDMQAEERLVLARHLRAITRAAGTWLSISADVALAKACGADGVHLQGLGAIAEARRSLGADAVIGVSIHRPAETDAARDAGADYATLSPIFATSSKPGYGPALGTEALRAASLSGLPILALGGVDAGNAGACLAAGAAGIAVMGGVMRAEDPLAEVARLRGAIA